MGKGNRRRGILRTSTRHRLLDDGWIIESLREEHGIRWHKGDSISVEP